MVQGSLKKVSKPASSKKSVLGLKKGARKIAPKKATLVKQQKLIKKLSSGLTAKTERSLAQRAGHLEMLKGTRKDIEKAAAAKK
ncbi:hypothetical protein FQN57_005906 [Myotisia sp. PD_48]|nr:hypothetical protein FQN57_005906 [Myotisia sp. PD_48]